MQVDFGVKADAMGCLVDMSWEKLEGGRCRACLPSKLSRSWINARVSKASGVLGVKFRPLSASNHPCDQSFRCARCTMRHCLSGNFQSLEA